MNLKLVSPLILGLTLFGSFLSQDVSTAKKWAIGLNSPNMNELHATIDVIESQGLKALPNLREVAQTVTGEPRSRALNLIERIGTERLLRHTPVTLDVKDLTPADAIQRLSESAGFAIELDPSDKEVGRKLTVHTEQPIGFFEALDRLGSVGDFRQDSQTAIGRKQKSGVTVWIKASSTGPPPTSYAGPYKVVLRALERHRQVVQTRNPADAKVKEEFFAVLDVVAEPGILIERNGTATIREAVDETGNDLRATSSSDPSASIANSRAWIPEEIKQFSYRLPLHLPETHGVKIARLRGFLPITAVTRTDELFSSPLAGIQGKVIGARGVSLTVTNAVTGIPASLELTIRGSQSFDPRVTAFAPGPRQTTLATLPQSFGSDDHLRIDDAEGRPYGFHSNSVAPVAPDGSMRFRITIFANAALGPPARIRYFGVAGVATEVPFDFQNVEIP